MKLETWQVDVGGGRRVGVELAKPLHEQLWFRDKQLLHAGYTHSRVLCSNNVRSSLLVLYYRFYERLV